MTSNVHNNVSLDTHKFNGFIVKIVNSSLNISGIYLYERSDTHIDNGTAELLEELMTLLRNDVMNNVQNCKSLIQFIIAFNCIIFDKSLYVI